jgi:hypothetical protein
MVPHVADSPRIHCGHGPRVLHRDARGIVDLAVHLRRDLVAEAGVTADSLLFPNGRHTLRVAEGQNVRDVGR